METGSRDDTHKQQCSAVARHRAPIAPGASRPASCRWSVSPVGPSCLLPAATPLDVPTVGHVARCERFHKRAPGRDGKYAQRIVALRSQQPH
eukprot:scaffold17500_cov126-Isochrysis_galbana.AAC.6